MQKNKRFDCVEMKNRIQAQLLKEWEGKTDAQVREEMHRSLQTSQSPVAQFWRRIKKKDGSPGVPAALSL